MTAAALTAHRVFASYCLLLHSGERGRGDGVGVGVLYILPLFYEYTFGFRMFREEGC